MPRRKPRRRGLQASNFLSEARNPMNRNPRRMQVNPVSTAVASQAVVDAQANQDQIPAPVSHFPLRDVPIEKPELLDSPFKGPSLRERFEFCVVKFAKWAGWLYDYDSYDQRRLDLYIEAQTKKLS